MIDKKIYSLYKVVTDDWPQDEYYSESQIALKELKEELMGVNEWIDASIMPEFPCSLIIASFVYPTMVIRFNTEAEFYNHLPTRYIYLPPSP